MRGCLLALLLLLAWTGVNAQEGPADTALAHSVQQLRDVIGRWDVTTDFLEPDGSVARSVKGQYEFSWVIPDRVVSGRSELPALDQVSALLFYVDPAKRKIEMVSVGADGTLWTMSGPLGAEVRTSQAFETSDGGSGQLRFTRFNAGVDSFESRMEYTQDGGSTWLPGNHQRFERWKPSTEQAPDPGPATRAPRAKREGQDRNP